MLLSLFCGAGGLDLGFEQAGFKTALAYDKKGDSVASHKHNREDGTARQADVRSLTLESLDRDCGAPFSPIGVIGGPPCQSFSKANRSAYDPEDPRHSLPKEYTRLVKAFNERSPLHFFAFENVTCLQRGKHKETFDKFIEELTSSGFNTRHYDLNAADYGVAQRRTRLIAVGFNRSIYGDLSWERPARTAEKYLTVKDMIGELPEPVHYRKGLDPSTFPKHVNHWCMAPKSLRFKEAQLRPGDGRKRSFKTLSWAEPSLTVAYGHREVHVHPSCTRRLSVYEAMLLQGFPADYELIGSLSSQIDQVSEAVPPPLAKAVATSIRAQLGERLLAALGDRVREQAA